MENFYGNLKILISKSIPNKMSTTHPIYLTNLLLLLLLIRTLLLLHLSLLLFLHYYYYFSTQPLTRISKSCHCWWYCFYHCCCKSFQCSWYCNSISKQPYKSWFTKTIHKQVSRRRLLYFLMELLFATKTRIGQTKGHNISYSISKIAPLNGSSFKWGYTTSTF